jgi:hypothetical protein
VAFRRVHSTTTGVPISEFSKNFSAI